MRQGAGCNNCLVEIAVVALLMAVSTRLRKIGVQDLLGVNVLRLFHCATESVSSDVSDVLLS